MLGSKKTKAKDDVAKVDVTPLIDVVFLLLIFLIIVVLTAASEITAELTLPMSRLADPEKRRDQDVLIVNLDNQGRTLVMAEWRTEDELRALLVREANRSMAPDGFAERSIYIRAHRDRPFGEVQDILGMCRDARIWKISLRALGEEKTE